MATPPRPERVPVPDQRPGAAGTGTATVVQQARPRNMDVSAPEGPARAARAVPCL